MPERRFVATIRRMAMKTHIDWASLLASEAKTQAVIRADEIAKKHNLAYSSVIAALVRQDRRGLTEHVFRNVYLNKLAVGYSSRDFVGAIDAHSYISLDSALLEWGVSNQSPIGLTCVRTSKRRTIRTASIVIEFRTISKDLFWGFVERKSRYGNYKIAEPEKALLDWVYLGLKGDVPPHLDELQFERLNIPKLLEIGKKFPRSVLETILPTVLEKCIPSQSVLQKV
jgi:predicted transcriptional regulator of viral defense system